MPFQKGQSGNPKGRPLGSRNKATIAADNLLDGQAEAITQKAMELALNGDSTALRLCMERINPPRRARPIKFDLPPIETVQDVMKALGTIAQLVAAGELTPDDGKIVSDILENRRKAIESVEFERRLAAIEQARAKA
jgi:hypothetical protein